MGAEKRVGLLSEELKRINAEISNNIKQYSSIDQSIQFACVTGDYDFAECNEWAKSKFLLNEKRKKLTKRQDNLVKKLRKIIARRNLAVDEETADLLK